MIFVSKFFEKAHFLARNALNNYWFELEKDENTIDSTCTNFRFMDFIAETLKQCRI